MMKAIARVAFVAVVALVASQSAAQSAATAMDDRWHGLVAPYLWGAGLAGDVGVNGTVSVPIDLSFGDTLENLDFAFLGRFEARRNRVGLGLDFAHLNLGADVTGPVAGQLGLGADVRTLTVEGLVTYRVVNDDAKGSSVDVLGGLRYMKNEAGLSLEQGGDEIRGTDQKLDWVDGLVGARFRLALGTKAGLLGRADVAGLGSDVTFNVQAGLDVAISSHWKTGAGYRYMHVDYDKGEGLERRIWKVDYQGPYAYVGYGW